MYTGERGRGPRPRVHSGEKEGSDHPAQVPKKETNKRSSPGKGKKRYFAIGSCTRPKKAPKLDHT